MPTGIYIRKPEALEQIRNIGLNKVGTHLSEETKKKISSKLKGKPKSAEHTRKNREVHLGQKGFWKGKKMSDKARENIRLSHIGIKYPNRKLPPPCTEEHRKKLSLMGKGKKHSLEWIEKCRLSNLGKKRPNSAKEKNPNWKGGITPENTKIRNSLEIKLWRDACFARDGYTCQKTGQIGGKLIVHHINNFADYPELRTAIDNGITLSHKAHQDFHRIYGKRNNTREQLLEFLANQNDK